MTSIELFDELNGKEVSRNYLEEILQQAKAENQTAIIYRVSKILNDYPNVQHFDINIVQYPAMQGLAGAMHTGDYREALDECGRLRKGWKFVKGSVIKVEKNKKVKQNKDCKTCEKSDFDKGLFVKIILPLYQKSKENPDKYAIKNGTENIFKVEDKAFWEAFRNVKNDYFKTLYASKKVKISDKGVDLLEKALKNQPKSEPTYKFLLYKTQTSNKYTLAFSYADLSAENADVFSFRKTHKSKGYNEYFVQNNQMLRENYKLHTDYKILTSEEYQNKDFYKVLEQVVEAKKEKTNDTKQETKAEKLIAKFRKDVLDYYTEVQKKYSAEKEEFIDKIKTDYKQHLELIIKNIIFYLENKPKSIELFINETIDKYKSGEFIENAIIFKKDSFSGVLVRNRVESEVYHNVYLNKVVPFFEKKNFLRKGKELDVELKAIKDIVDYRYKKGEAVYLDDAVPLYYLFRDNEKIESDLMIFDTEAEQYLNKYVEYAGDYNIKLNHKGKDLLTSIKNRVESLKNQKYNYSLFDGLAAPQPQLTTEDFKNMKVSELRKFTLDYYNTHLKGKKTAIKNHLKEVVFVSGAGRKLMQPIYKEKVAVMEHLEELIKNSTYNNWGNRKKTDSPDVLGYLNFKSKLIIDGEKKHIRISVIVDDKRKTRFKSFEVGTKPKKEASIRRVHFGNPKAGQIETSFEYKDTQNSEQSKKTDENFGLSVPQVYVETIDNEAFDDVKPATPIAVRKGSLAEKIQQVPISWQSYQIDRLDMAQFLGDVEIKNVDSLVITLTGGQGSGKTRFAFQFMNDLAQHYKVGHISIEEHPESRLYLEKVNQYLDATAQNNIEAHDVRSLEELHQIIERNDVIVIDSFQKIKELDSKFEVDKDLRKKYNGKLFLVIFQQTTDGKMRSGAKSQFDGDIILFTAKFPNYQENYVYPDKNRYNSLPTDQLKYSIYQQGLLTENETQTAENQVYNVIY